jgi:hypothetical protein
MVVGELQHNMACADCEAAITVANHHADLTVDAKGGSLGR